MKDYLKSEFNAFQQPVGTPIRQLLPVTYRHERLIGQFVELIPINDDCPNDLELEQLWQTLNTEPDARCWTYLPYEGFSNRNELKHALQTVFGFHPSYHYLIKMNGEVVGWIALLNPRLTHAVIEVGNVYFSHRLKRTVAATEAVFLLLKKCFEQNFRRIEWKCDDFNEPSKRAALRFGFYFEGLFRQDRVTKGHNRNTAWFSIIDGEWPELKAVYEAWLSPDNFDPQGSQKQRLIHSRLL
ncbi:MULTISPECIES: GNAT family N-acetyltransferase [unclassified Acinetobacter]|uniref:GNAT family N-acetyltransferase n=1 Tax=unclassified Acinetobacter TaxID=196816 RepID=UPI00190DFBAA|nr:MULTISPECIES: GNAT family N-acetyltransferase [unclassified Acinetobacter]MBK0064900.1 GNAT family N-acetyltransferase [Acinetobacter sp. S55]MBK0068277.1 GNAT family N-acetyltransferase [Acinetobacter sp. S54]